MDLRPGRRQTAYQRADAILSLIATDQDAREVVARGINAEVCGACHALGAATELAAAGLGALREAG